MSVNVSAPIKIFALVGLLAALVLGGGMMFLGRTPADTDAAPVALPTKKTGIADAPAAAKKVTAKANAVAKKTVTPAATTAEATPKPKAEPKPKPAAKQPAPVQTYRGIATNGLPMQIALALRRDDVVVVSLWGTGGKIDGLARDEARAGAAAAGAGFVALNVIDHAREAEALTLQVGTLLRAPAVLVFTRPKTVANRLDGFRDRDSVAQAALDALR